MSARQEPLVTVLTPIYNGEAFLAKCIESVLRQTYHNYEYIIVNNCSKDQSLAIAQGYANSDQRIRVHTNSRFVDVIENHNIAFNLISPTAKYCKVVSADDFIFPDCITRMVQCAETNPSVGIVGAYQLSGSEIRWQGFEYPRTVFPGDELCRRVFLGRNKGFGFGSPTSLMYRAEIVRSRDAFYPNPSPHSDTSACFRDLQTCDFGFVYEVLSYEKTHVATQSAESASMNRYSSAFLNDLIQYGPFYLSAKELRKEVNEQLQAYHQFLAINLFLGFRGQEFWKYHRDRLEELGHPLVRIALLKAATKKVLREILNPMQAIEKVWGRWFSRSRSYSASRV
jgi:glycosyltransferase involved in cell wall biosynthesis